jgi:ATP-dependent protease ClpP protease subunit
MQNNNQQSFLYTVNDKQEFLTPVAWFLLKKRKIVLHKVINEDVALDVCAGIEYLSDKSSEPITLLINSPGGHISDAFAIYDAMKSTECEVITVAKGSLISEVGTALRHVGKYDIKVLNTINFAKSMKYNPFEYIRSEKDILKLANTIIANTKGDGEKSGEDFWVKAERLLYCALIGFIWYEAPDDEKNITTLIDMINASETREDDESFKNVIDEMFDDLAAENPDHFAVRQYSKYKLSAGKTAKSILVSCGARLAPFDIKELREDMCGVPTHAFDNYAEKLNEAGYSFEIGEISEKSAEISAENIIAMLKYDSNLHLNVRKEEILEYFLEHDDPKERAEFMKAAYSHRVQPVMVDGNKYEYQKTADNLVLSFNDEMATVPWIDVQAHVAELIANHDYLDVKTKIEIDEFSELSTPSASEQMSLFDDDESAPEVSANSNSRKITAVDEMIIKAELMGGSNFQDGKFRIEEFAKTSPTTAEFAAFLKDEYGIGGGSGNSHYVDSQKHDSKGIHLDIIDENSRGGIRKLDVSWNTAAKFVSDLVNNGEYVTEDDIKARISHAEYVLNNYNPDNEMDLRAIEKAEKVLELYGMFEEDLDDIDVDETIEDVDVEQIEEVSEVSEADVSETSEEPPAVQKGDILELDRGIFEVVHVSDGVLKLWDTTFEDLLTITEDELHNQRFTVLEQKPEVAEHYRRITAGRN